MRLKKYKRKTKTRRRRKIRRGGMKKRGRIGVKKTYKKSIRKTPKNQKPKQVKISKKYLKNEKIKEEIRQSLMRENIGKIGVPSIGNARKLYKRGNVITALATLSAALTTPRVGKDLGFNEPEPILPMQCNATNWALPYQINTDPRKKSLYKTTRRVGRLIKNQKKTQKSKKRRNKE